MRIEVGNREPESAPVQHEASKKFFERSFEEFDKSLKKFDQRMENLENSYGKQAIEMKTLQGQVMAAAQPQILQDIKLQLAELEHKVNSKISSPNDRSPLLNYTISDPSERKDKSSKKIIINNTEDFDSQKSTRDIVRKIEDLRTDTFRQFDFVGEELKKFRTAVDKTLDRQDQSLLAILTRVTSLEIRVDGLEFDGLKKPGIDSGLRDKGKANRQQMIESLQISEKLLEDFQIMRKEVFSKLFEIQEKHLKNKANVKDILLLENKFDERFNVYEQDTKKYKNELKESIRAMQDRIKKQNVPMRAVSPMADINSSAILSKRYNDGAK